MTFLVMYEDITSCKSINTSPLRMAYFLHMGQGFPHHLTVLKNVILHSHVRRVAFITFSRALLLYKITFISPLPVFTPEGTIGLPSVRPSVSLSVSLSVRKKSGSFDNLKTIKARHMKLGMWLGGNVYNMHVQHLDRYLKGQGHTFKWIANR